MVTVTVNATNRIDAKTWGETFDGVEELEVYDGTLSLSAKDDTAIAMFAPGSWLSVKKVSK